MSEKSGMSENYALPQSVCVGHIHLMVTNLERSIAFYRDVLGFHISEDMRTEPNPRRVVFLSANAVEHHHVALMEMSHLQPVTAGYAGLYHAAFLYPGRYSMALALKHILEMGYPVDHCHDYGSGESVNLRDPDGIPLELYYALDPALWPRVDGQVRVYNRKIEIEDLLKVLEEPAFAVKQG
jgi:catechol 2,3-dioxygenase